jgi:hypothetical protein
LQVVKSMIQCVKNDLPPLYNWPDARCCFSYLASSHEKYVVYYVARFLCVYISIDRTQEYGLPLPSRTFSLFSVSFFLPAAEKQLRICFFFPLVGIFLSYQYLNHRTGIQSMSMVLNNYLNRKVIVIIHLNEIEKKLSETSLNVIANRKSANKIHQS